MKGLLYNPMFNASMGLLAAGGPSKFPVGIGQALQQGLLGAQRADMTGRKLGALEQEQALKQQQMQMEAEAMRQAQMQQQQQQAAMEQISANLPPEARGLLAAGVPLKEVATSYGLLPTAPTPTSGMQEYEQARAQGFQGTFLDYKRALAEAGRSSTVVNNNMPGSGLETRRLTSEEAAALNLTPEQAAGLVVEGDKVKPAPMSLPEAEAAKTEASVQASFRGFENLFNEYDMTAKTYQQDALALPGSGEYARAQAARSALVAWVAKNVLGTPGAEPSPALYEQAEKIVPDFAGPFDRSNFEENMKQVRRQARAKLDTARTTPLPDGAPIQGAAIPPPPGFVED